MAMSGSGSGSLSDRVRSVALTLLDVGALFGLILAFVGGVASRSEGVVGTIGFVVFGVGFALFVACVGFSKTSAPLGGTLIGLALVFVGERVLSHTGAYHWVATGAGLVLVVGSASFRWVAAARARSERRTVEAMFAIQASVGVLALLIYLMTVDPLADWVGISSLATKTRQRTESVATVVWIVLLLSSTLPQVFAEIALNPMRKAANVEWRRVRGAAYAGLSLALAASYGALFTFVADQLKVQADYSYFKTSRPSEPTVNITKQMTQSLRVTAFFPPVNEVADEVRRYLQELERSSGNVSVEFLDRLLVPAVAKEAKVQRDGVIVFRQGDRQETVTVGTEMAAARPKLKKLDSEVRETLLRVLRKPRTAYLTVGHGELNDSQPTEQAEGRTASGLRELLEMQNYHVRDLGLVQGLGKEVPDDATVVLVLGPSEPFTDSEVAALGRYAQRGGHLLLAIDAEAKVQHEALAAVAGLQIGRDILCNEQAHVARRYSPSDNAIIYSNRFSVHPSVSTLARLGSRVVFFIGTGSLEKRPDADPSLSVDFALKTLPGTFADKNANFVFDKGSENQATQNLMAAVSAKRPAAPKKEEGPGEASESRMVVLADADVLSDAPMMSPGMINGNPQFFADIIRWLGGEEALAGEETSTEDVRIEHTKGKDRVLFYLTIFGAPALVLGGGLTYVRRRRAGSRSKVSS